MKLKLFLLALVALFLNGCSKLSECNDGKSKDLVEQIVWNTIKEKLDKKNEIDKNDKIYPRTIDELKKSLSLSFSKIIEENYSKEQKTRNCEAIISVKLNDNIKNIFNSVAKNDAGVINAFGLSFTRLMFASSQDQTKTLTEEEAEQLPGKYLELRTDMGSSYRNYHWDWYEDDIKYLNEIKNKLQSNNNLTNIEKNVFLAQSIKASLPNLLQSNESIIDIYTKYGATFVNKIQKSFDDNGQFTTPINYKLSVKKVDGDEQLYVETVVPKPLVEIIWEVSAIRRISDLQSAPSKAPAPAASVPVAVAPPPATVASAPVAVAPAPVPAPVAAPPAPVAAPVASLSAGFSFVAPPESKALLTSMLVGAMNPMKLAELKGSIEELPKPATGNRKAARALNEKGLQALKSDKFDEALSLLKQGVETDNADIEIRNNYVFALIKAKKFPEAEKEAGIALTQSPGRSTAWANLGEIYAAKGSISEATAALMVAFQFSSNKDKTLTYLKEKSTSADLPAMQEAAKKAIQRLSSVQ